MQSQHIGIGNKTHAVRRLVHGLAIGGNLYKEASAGLEVITQKIVEAQHMLLLGELHMVGNVLQYFGHEHKPTFGRTGHLLAHNS